MRRNWPETYVINQMNLQTTLATKAARCVWAAQGRGIADFASRRTHGSDAALKMARASYIAGFASTSNVLAASHYNIPPAGTMAHFLRLQFPHGTGRIPRLRQQLPRPHHLAAGHV